MKKFVHTWIWEIKEKERVYSLTSLPTPWDLRPLILECGYFNHPPKTLYTNMVHLMNDTTDSDYQPNATMANNPHPSPHPCTPYLLCMIRAPGLPWYYIFIYIYLSLSLFIYIYLSIYFGGYGGVCTSLLKMG